MDGFMTKEIAMQLAVKLTGYIKVKKSAQQRIAKAQREGLCCACMEPLDDTRTIRGCHERCRQAAARLIERGVVTEEQLIADGELLPADTGGRRPSNALTKKYA